MSNKWKIYEISILAIYEVWKVTNDVKKFTCETKEDAEWLLDLLNAQKQEEDEFVWKGMER